MPCAVQAAGQIQPVGGEQRWPPWLTRSVPMRTRSSTMSSGGCRLRPLLLAIPPAWRQAARRRCRRPAGRARAGACAAAARTRGRMRRGQPDVGALAIAIAHVAQVQRTEQPALGMAHAERAVGGAAGACQREAQARRRCPAARTPRRAEQHQRAQQQPRATRSQRRRAGGRGRGCVGHARLLTGPVRSRCAVRGRAGPGCARACPGRPGSCPPATASARRGRRRSSVGSRCR